MATAQECAVRYLQVCKGDAARHVRAGNVYAEGATIYSYGRHFPMAEYFRAGRYGRTAPLLLLNGDRASNTTDRHQSAVRDAVRQAQAFWPSLQSLIVPFSALDAARIQRETIRPLDVRADRVDRWRETVPGDFDNPVWSGVRTTAGGAPAGDSVKGAVFEKGRIPGNPSATATRCHRGYSYTAAYDSSGTNGFVDYDPPRESFYANNGNVQVEYIEGNWSVERTRHWLGDALFTAAVPVARVRTRERTLAEVISYARFAAKNHTDAATAIEEWPLQVEDREVVHERRKYISSFDYNERRPLYFLATMPKGSAKTVAQAIDELAPRAVHAALARSIDVERQGDIFAIATPLTDADVYGRAVTRARRTQWTGSPARPGEIGAPSPADTARRYRAAKKDRAEILRRYWTNRAAQWRDWESLRGMPRERRDKAMRLPRQSWNRRTFAHAATALDLATQATMAKYEPGRERTRTALREGLSIFGTAHTATEVVKAKGGAVYIRGLMYHEPSLEPGRRGGVDHARRPLGDRSTWYLAIRNTVPRQR